MSSPTSTSHLQTNPPLRQKPARNPTAISLGIVAVTFVLIQLLAIDDFYISHDEGVYLLESRSLGRSRYWYAHRSLGVPLLLFPLNLGLSDSVFAIRTWMAIVHGVLLFFAFRPWLKTVGKAAVAAAAVFAFSWPTLFYGSMALPNTASALVATGLVGALLAPLAHSPSRHTHSLWIFSAALVLLRPVEAIPVLPISIAAAGAYVWTQPPRIEALKRYAINYGLPVLVGLGAGSVVWIVESIARFGGPIERVRGIRGLITQTAGDPMSVLHSYLAGLDGAGMSSGVSLLDITIILAVAFGLLAGIFLPNESSPVRLVTTLSAAFGFLLLAGYLTYDYLDLRFLLPAWAAITIASAMGYRTVFRPASKVARAVIASVPIILCAWSLNAAISASARQVLQAEPYQVMAEEIQTRANGRSCAFFTDAGAPQVDAMSGCEGYAVSSADLGAEVDQELTGSVEIRFAYFREPPPPGTFLEAWDVQDFQIGGEVWTLFTQPTLHD